MLEEGPVNAWKGVALEEGHDTVPPDLSGFKVLSDRLRATNSELSEARQELAVALDGIPADGLLDELGRLGGVERVEQVASPGGLRARLYLTGEAPQLVAPVAAVVAGHRARLTDVTIGIPSLEDVFIALTGRTLR